MVLLAFLILMILKFVNLVFKPESPWLRRKHTGYEKSHFPRQVTTACIQ